MHALSTLVPIRDKKLSWNVKSFEKNVLHFTIDASFLNRPCENLGKWSEREKCKHFFSFMRRKTSDIKPFKLKK